MTASTLSQGYRHTARLFIYEIPISRLAIPSRFFMAFGPRQQPDKRKLEKSSWLTWTKVRGVAESLFWYSALWLQP